MLPGKTGYSVESPRTLSGRLLTTTVRLLLVAAFTAAGIAVTGLPAYAAEASCSTPFFGGTCRTGTVAASPGGSLYARIEAGLSACSYEIYDVTNSKTIRAGAVDQLKDRDEEMRNVHSRYKMWLSGVACWGGIHNNSPAR